MSAPVSGFVTRHHGVFTYYRLLLDWNTIICPFSGKRLRTQKLIAKAFCLKKGNHNKVAIVTGASRFTFWWLHFQPRPLFAQGIERDALRRK